MKTIRKISLAVLLISLFVGGCKKDQSSACISFSTSTPLINQNITFTDCASGATSAAWTFGDGTTGSGTVTSHVYYSVGTYAVTLISTNSSGQSATTTKTIVVKALPTATISYNFCGYSGVNAYVLAYDSVVFSALNSNATSYLWDFGDGTTSTDSMSIHVFSQLNSQQVVKLRVSNSLGSDSTTLTFAVQTLWAGTFNFRGGGYGNVGITNSTGLTAGSTFVLPGYPSYDPYATCSTTTGTVTSSKSFVIKPQSITFVNGAGGSNINATIHGHGYMTGTCSTGKLFIIDTMVTSTGTTLFNDSLFRQ